MFFFFFFFVFSLRLRLDRPELFDRYAPVPVLGASAEHAIAFDRGGAVTVATRLPLGLARVGWQDTSIIVPSVPMVDVVTGRVHPGGELRLDEVLARYPVALLARMEEL